MAQNRENEQQIKIEESWNGNGIENEKILSKRRHFFHLENSDIQQNAIHKSDRGEREWGDTKREKKGKRNLNVISII